MYHHGLIAPIISLVCWTLLVMAWLGYERIRNIVRLRLKPDAGRFARDLDALMPFVHLPVQSGSDRILSAMKRNHTALEYKAKIRKLKAAKPGICISTDMIVGFPGETDRDFEATMKLIEDVGFDQSFSFIYS